MTDSKLIKAYGLTFHASHNFGSMLQAYALQSFLEEYGIDYKILNFRNDIQKRLYRKPTIPSGLKDLYVDTLLIGSKLKRLKGWTRFEDFIKFDLKTTEEFSNVDERIADLVNKNSDCMFCGSDQIWNENAKDFCLTYLLPFYKKPKFAVSVSMGPKPHVSERNKTYYSDALNEFGGIAVREEGTRKEIESLGVDAAELACDPVFLLNKQRWIELSSSAAPDCVPKKPYILFYDLKRNTENWKLAHKISRSLKMPIYICSTPFPRTVFQSLKFRKKLDAGPKEFLSLLNSASLVLTSSFHGTAFSLIYNKRFFVLDSNKDSRLSEILGRFRLQDLTISSLEEFSERKDYLPDFPSVNQELLNMKTDLVSKLDKWVQSL